MTHQAKEGVLAALPQQRIAETEIIAIFVRHARVSGLLRFTPKPHLTVILSKETCHTPALHKTDFHPSVVHEKPKREVKTSNKQKMQSISFK